MPQFVITEKLKDFCCVDHVSYHTRMKQNLGAQQVVNYFEIY